MTVLETDKPWQEVSERFEERDGRGRLRKYVILRCVCGETWQCRADNLSRMLSRQCWHPQTEVPCPS